MFPHYYHYPNKPNKIKAIKSQIELLKLLASGMTLREIAEKTGKKYNNIKKRTQLLYLKFNASSRKDLIRIAKKEGFISHKDITNKFRKRFVKNIETLNTTSLKIELTEREIKHLQLKSQGVKQKDLIEQLGLWSYYGLKQKEFHICTKLNCKNFLEAIFIAKSMEII